MYAVQIGSRAMRYEYIPSFIKIGSGVQKLIGEIHRHRDSMVISQAYFYFFKIREVG
jgi:hypothetical protein